MHIKRTKFIILFTLFFNLTYLNANQNNLLINQISTNEFSLTYSDIEKEYFKKHPWDFMDSIFIEKFTNLKTIYDKIPAIASAVPYLGVLLGFAYFVNGYGQIHKDHIASLILGEILAIPTSIIIYKLTKYLFSSKRTLNQLNRILIWFMENYNPNLNINSKNNIKNFVPQELQEIFDNMYREYLRQGTSYLQSAGVISTIRRIIEKIMYEIKIEKYRMPSVIEANNYASTSSTDYPSNIY